MAWALCRLSGVSAMAMMLLWVLRRVLQLVEVLGFLKMLVSLPRQQLGVDCFCGAALCVRGCCGDVTGMLRL